MNNLNHYELSRPGRFVTARCWGQWAAQCESAPTWFSKRFLLTPSTEILTTWLKGYHPFRSIYGAFTQFLFLPYIFDRSHCPNFFLDLVRYSCQEELFKFLNDNIIICLASSGRERFRSRYLRPAGRRGASAVVPGSRPLSSPLPLGPVCRRYTPRLPCLLSSTPRKYRALSAVLTHMLARPSTSLTFRHTGSFI